MMFFPHLRSFLAVLVSLVLIALVCWVSGVANLMHRLGEFPLWGVASMLILLMGNLFLVSFRFWRILAHFGIDLSWKVAFQANISGSVAGLIVFPLFGQMMGRQSVLQRFGVHSVVNASLIAYERFLLALVSGTLGILGGIVLFGGSAVAEFFNKVGLLEIGIAAGGGIALSLWLGGSRFEKRLSKRTLSRANLNRVLTITALTLAGQLLMLGSFVLGSLALNPTLSPGLLFAASAIISFAASMPITVGGWGAREIAAVYVLSVLGISATDAVTMSVVVGLCSTLVILAPVPFCLRSSSHA
jgi:uncharacterized membrane protein YbhN (UPF0104 family)